VQQPWRLIVFDCDGTLVDSQAVIVACVQAAFAREGLSPPLAQAVRQIVGLSLVQAMLQLMPEPELAGAERLAATYKEAFFEHRRRPDHDEPLFPGVVEVLTSLRERGCLLGIATGKAMRGLRHVLDHHGIEHYFTTLQTADHHPSKPHPAMLEAAMRDTGLTAAETALVGDTTFDIEMARAAGATAIGVTWGNHSPAILRRAGATHMLARLPELLTLRAA
jgi:phosphoglycolate phosphatase